MIGQTVSHYKILEKLGEGGMGLVYKAVDTKLKRTVALKFLPPLLTGTEAKDRFIAEARAAAALNHPNIVTVHEINEYNNRIYIAMEYVQGENLKEKIASGPLKIDEALRISRKVAKGLREAHEKGIIHRDIKSANIMVDEKGQVKIMDFGLAKLKSQTKFTKTGVVMGTTAYMSPEQTQGSAVDHRTDIWSLGVVLYEIVTGKLPFRGEYEQAIIYSIMNEEPEPLSALRTGVPMELERIINKALSKSPSNRCQEVNDLIVGLKKLRKIPVSELERSNPVRKFLIPGILLLTAFFITGYFIFKKKSGYIIPVTVPGVMPSLAVVYFENNSGDESLDNWRSALSELLTTDLSQSRYIRVLRSDEIYSILKRLNLLESPKYTTKNLRAIAREGGVNHVLKGSFIKAGNNFLVTAILINAITSETISSLSLKAEGENNIFTIVDDLTKKIKLKLNISSDLVDHDLDMDIKHITTNSPEAFKLYIEGRKYYYSGEPGKSILLMKDAVTIDPEFAMAYRSIAAGYSGTGHRRKGMKYYQKAVELSHHLSDLERSLIRGDFYRQWEVTYDKAIKAYKTGLKLYPQYSAFYNNLSLVYAGLDEWDKVIELCQKFREINKNSLVINYNLSKAYWARGLFKKSKEIIGEFAKNSLGNKYALIYFILTHIPLGQFNHALEEMDKAFSFNPTDFLNILVKGDIFYFKGDLIKAEKEYRKFTELKLTAAFILAGMDRLGALYLLQGKFEESKGQVMQRIDLAKKSDEKLWEASLRHLYAYLLLKTGHYKKALAVFNNMRRLAAGERNLTLQQCAVYGRGMVWLKMKLPQKARQAADELHELITNSLNKKMMRYYYHLMGRIELTGSNYPLAIEYFNRAIHLIHYNTPFYDKLPVRRAIFIDSLAEAYYRADNEEKARQAYEQIAAMNYSRIGCDDVYARSFYHLGKIYREKGLNTKARENYSKFIELWKDCDPQFQPLVKDAEKWVNLPLM